MVGRKHRNITKAQEGGAFAMPSCGVEDVCGACSHLGIPYADQLAEKDGLVHRLFVDGGLCADDAVRPIIGMDVPYRYRNKVISPFAPGKRLPAKDGAKGRKGGQRTQQAPRREILTGMYAKGTHRLVNADSCLIENERAQQVIGAIRSIMGAHGMEPYDEDAGEGFVRHAIVRVGHESGEVLVTIVTNGEEFPSSRSFCRELVKRCPFVTSVVQNINTRQTNVILGQREKRLYGPGFILDTLCGLSFRISSQSFYQVNAVQTAVLYEQAVGFAGLTGTEAVIDAYCGTGTIGLVAAARGAARVVGVDSVESAIRDARENARHNGIANAEFVAADATDYLRAAARDGQRCDVVFLDPPRSGSTEAFLAALAQMAPSRVVYVSCNPETQVRDLRILAGHGYRVEAVQPVDMFPHTDHVETVVLMSKA